MIGINNRDLNTFVTDTAVTLRLAPKIPEGTLVVAESGLVHARTTSSALPRSASPPS